jgi:serine/threonine protein kinase
MTDPLVGTTVAHYEVLGKLGGGGQSVVYAARDTKLGRRVALKFLPPQWSHDESAKQRFVREPQEHLHHPRHRHRARWSRLHRDGAVRRADAEGKNRTGSATDGRGD